MFGKLETQEVEEALTHQHIGRLAYCAGGRPYIIPISYAYDGKYLYFHSSYEGEKLKLMRKNPEVCFQIDVMKNMADWKSVICRGTFEEIMDEQQRAAALKILLLRELPFIISQTVKLSPNWPFQPDDYNDVKGIVFRIYITEKSGRFENLLNQRAAEMTAFT